MLSKKIQDDLTKSIKAKEQDKVDVLRFVLAEIKNARIEKGEDLDDDEIVKLLKKHVKKLRDAAEMFKKGDREDMASENEAQIVIIQEYLPKEISDEELTAEIDRLIEAHEDLYEQNPHAIIGIAMKELSTKADPQRILAEIKSREDDE